MDRLRVERGDDLWQIEHLFGRLAQPIALAELPNPERILSRARLQLACDGGANVGRFDRSRAVGREPAYLVQHARRERLDMPVSFDRRELDQILRLYGRMVAANEWRDYAIDHLSDRAVFSVFRRTSETPLFQIVKDPKLARKQGAYSVVAATGMILRRGHELARVLGIFDKRLRLVQA